MDIDPQFYFSIDPGFILDVSLAFGRCLWLYVGSWLRLYLSTDSQFDLSIHTGVTPRSPVQVSQPITKHDVHICHIFHAFLARYRFELFFHLFSAVQI